MLFSLKFPWRWSGKFKDQIVPEGTYLYLLSIKYVDGEIVNLNGEI